jgi:hypothetical protein
MSDSFSFTEMDGQRVELLPARTVLSMINKAGGGGGNCRGGDAYGGIGIGVVLDLLSTGSHTPINAGNAYGGHGGKC